MQAGNSAVHDTVVNQLLAKMDGVEQLNNILVIGAYLPVTCYLSLIRVGCWGTAEATWGNFLHSFPFTARRRSASPWVWSIPWCCPSIFFWAYPFPSCLAGTVPCRMVFDKPMPLVTCPHHLSFLFFTTLSSSTNGPAAVLTFSTTWILATRSL